MIFRFQKNRFDWNARRMTAKLLELHFDGKIRKSWGEKNDYLALCVTGPGMSKEKVLGDIPVPRGTGRNMSTAAVDILDEWGILRRAWALAFDTTPTNTGHNQ